MNTAHRIRAYCTTPGSYHLATGPFDPADFGTVMVIDDDGQRLQTGMATILTLVPSSTTMILPEG